MYEAFKQWLLTHDFDYPYSLRSLDAYLRTITGFMAYLKRCEVTNLNEVNSPLLRQFIKFKDNGEKYAVNSSNIRLAALNLFFAWAVPQQHCDCNPISAYKEAEKQRKTFGGRGGRKPLRLPAVLSLAEIEALQDVILPGEGFNAMRDACIILLLLATGLRADETVNLRINQVNFQAGFVRLIGKGNKERLVQIDNSMCESAYQAWVLKRQEKLQALKQESEYLFITNQGTPLTRRLLYQQISRYMKLAKVQTERVGAHTLRHTAASLMLQRQIPLTVIQQNLGHDDLKTTTRYLHLIRQV